MPAHLAYPPIVEWVEVAYVVLGVLLGAVATVVTSTLVERRRERRQRRSHLQRGVVGLRQRSRQVVENIEAAYDLRRAGRDGWQVPLQDAREYAFAVEYRFLELEDLGPDRVEAGMIVNQLFRRVLHLIHLLEHYDGGARHPEIESELATAWEERERLRRLLMAAVPSDPAIDPIEPEGERSHVRRAKLRAEEERTG